VAPLGVDPAVVAAQATLAAQRLSIEDLVAATTAPMTVGEFVARFLPTVSTGSRRAYGSYLWRFADDYATRALTDITVTDLSAVARSRHPPREPERSPT
jgi:hypothetical protein